MKNIFSIVLVWITSCVYAQDESRIKVRALVKDNHVFVRWIPTDILTLQQTLGKGYILESANSQSEITSAAELNNVLFTVLDTIKPWAKTDTAWVPLIKNDINQAFVYECLYDKSVLNEMRFGLFLKSCDLNVTSAKAAGLFYPHHSKEKSWVVYRIRIQGTNKTAFISLQPSVNTVLKPIQVTETSSGDRTARFMFDSRSNYLDYAGYVVQRSEDSISFTTITKNPIVRVVTEFEKDKLLETFTDTTVANDKPYYYRVVGLTHFGVEGKISNVVKIIPHRGFQSDVWLDSSLLKQNKAVYLQWHMDANDEVMVKNYLVFRKPATSGKYVKIAEVTGKRKYIDSNPVSAAYYRIAAISSKSDTAWSLESYITLADITPPSAPQGLKAVCDSNGIVSITWNKNKEFDLLGYRLFKTNVASDEFTEVSNDIIKENYFKDTLPLQVLDRNCYYKVMAVDQVYNVSTASTVIKVRRPDKINPVAPEFSYVSHNSSAILLKWSESPSEDILNIELLRKTTGEINYRQVKTFGARDTSHTFTDTLIVQGKTYLYQLLARDSSGNISLSNSFTIQFSTGMVKSMNAVNCLVNREKRQIQVKWEPPVNGEIFSYQLFKAKKGEQLRLFKTLEADKLSIVDKQLYPGNTYVYCIKAVLVSGAQTEMSGQTEIEY